LGNRLTGGYDSRPDTDLGDVVQAIASVESAIDLPDAVPIIEAIDPLGDRLTGGFGTNPDTDLGDVARAIASVECTIDLK
jgi:hypothetical protein